MKEKEIRDYIEDILSEMDKIEKFSGHIEDIEDFKKNEMAAYATMRALEIIGEAIKHIPEEERKKYPQITPAENSRDFLINSLDKFSDLSAQHRQMIL